MDKRINEIKNEIEDLNFLMPNTFEQQRNRNRYLFILCKELEQLENSKSYEENKAHWENHEIRI